MSNVICFPGPGTAPASGSRSVEIATTGQGAEILFFTGVRYCRPDSGPQASQAPIGRVKKKEA